MVATTTLSFYRPRDIRDDARAKHTDTEREFVCTVRGHLQHRSMTRAQTDLGVGDSNNWTFFGSLPATVSPTTRWTAEATAENRKRVFEVSGAAPGLHGNQWQIALRETEQSRGSGN